jgi:hypothetical protein
MGVQQLTLAHPQGLAAFLGKLRRRQFALDANEIGTGTIAALVEPVGEDQARSLVPAILGDGLEEGGFVPIEHRLAPVRSTITSAGTNASIGHGELRYLPERNKSLRC